ncbi:hypothetical protein G7Z17_g2086 [Cylindrodendrum hubeiense]|uniref:Uncharacterized protein n=1 Tax=Cylindrodendrum hubeiense TaxID=595255 RepID=A0A9P5HI90_9HYPO|nr:hypothetical protein G7Z17_g2086 [Cylindrodendrum hubeiense]
MDRHANLVEALTDFYTVLVQLCIVAKPMLCFPDQINGIEGFDSNAIVALEAGFSPEAVKLMARLPYLDPEIEEADEDGFELNNEVEIMPSTYPLAFTTNGEPNAFCENGNHLKGNWKTEDLSMHRPSSLLRY